MGSINKKIRNATVNKQGNITFKSILEKTCFNTLIEAGFNPLYEPKKHVVFPSFKPITPFYDKETDKQNQKRAELLGKKVSKILVKKEGKVIGIRYKPDFYFNYNGLDVYIEAKGIENDVFYIKKKMFIKYLDDVLVSTGRRSIYFEVYTKGQLLQAIEIIKDYATECNSQTDTTS